MPTSSQNMANAKKIHEGLITTVETMRKAQETLGSSKQSNPLFNELLSTMADKLTTYIEKLEAASNFEEMDTVLFEIQYRDYGRLETEILNKMNQAAELLKQFEVLQGLEAKASQSRDEEYKGTLKQAGAPEIGDSHRDDAQSDEDESLSRIGEKTPALQQEPTPKSSSSGSLLESSSANDKQSSYEDDRQQGEGGFPMQQESKEESVPKPSQIQTLDELYKKLAKDQDNRHQEMMSTMKLIATAQASFAVINKTYKYNSPVAEAIQSFGNNNNSGHVHHVENVILGGIIDETDAGQALSKLGLVEKFDQQDDLMKLLCKHYPDAVNYKSPGQGYTAAMEFIDNAIDQEKTTERLNYLIQQEKFDPIILNKEGQTTLAMLFKKLEEDSSYDNEEKKAMSSDYASTINLLLNHSATKGRDNYFDAALIAASACENSPIREKSLNEMLDTHKFSPKILGLVLINVIKDTERCKTLINMGADLTVKSQECRLDNNNALFAAVNEGNLDVVELLIKQDPGLVSTDFKEEREYAAKDIITPLAFAIHRLYLAEDKEVNVNIVIELMDANHIRNTDDIKDLPTFTGCKAGEILEKHASDINRILEQKEKAKIAAPSASSASTVDNCVTTAFKTALSAVSKEDKSSSADSSDTPTPANRS